MQLHLLAAVHLCTVLRLAHAQGAAAGAWQRALAASNKAKARQGGRGAQSAHASDIRVEIVDHAPCSGKDAPQPQFEKVRFPSMSTSNTERTADGSNCFRIKNGTLNIRGDLRIGNMQVYNRVQLGSGVNEDEDAARCKNADRSGCGGVGSCFYCDLCHSSPEKDLKKYVALRGNSSAVECDTLLVPAHYPGLELEFCLPEKDNFLQLLDDEPAEAEAIWDSFFTDNVRGRQLGMNILINSYMFDTNVLGYVRRYPGTLGKIIKSSKFYVGCHWVHARIYDVSKRR